MEVITIFHLAIVALAIFQAEAVPGQQDCPLQCQCDDSKPDRGFAVTCVEPSFSELPAFPRSAKYILIKGKSKVSKIYKGALSGLGDLKTFSFHTSGTWTFENGVFDHLVNLKSLCLQSYVPNTLPADVLRGLDLENLKLNLQRNVLPYDGICGQRHLLLLNLGNNEMKKLTLPKCVSKMIMLSTVLLKDNKFTVLYQADFEGLKRTMLKLLSVSNCRISSVHEDTFQPLIHITDLYLDDNRISHLPQNVFGNLWNLTILNLGNNRFTKLPCDIFRHVTALKQLFLQDLTQISHTNVCPQFESLSRLYLLYLDISRIPYINDTSLLPLKQVRCLSLTVQSFSKEALTAVPHLNNLLLTGGHLNLTGLANAVIGLNHTNIRTFTVRESAKISSLPGDLFSPLKYSRLTSLSMNKCYIKTVGRDTFSPLRNLQRLDLSNNQIESFPNGTFRHLINMKLLLIRQTYSRQYHE